MNVAELNKYLRAKMLAKNIAKFYQKDTLKFYKKLQNSTKNYTNSTKNKAKLYLVCPRQRGTDGLQRAQCHCFRSPGLQ